MTDIGSKTIKTDLNGYWMRRWDNKTFNILPFYGMNGTTILMYAVGISLIEWNDGLKGNVQGGYQNDL
jgi:hypothetical protein